MSAWTKVWTWAGVVLVSGVLAPGAGAAEAKAKPREAQQAEKAKPEAPGDQPARVAAEAPDPADTSPERRPLRVLHDPYEISGFYRTEGGPPGRGEEFDPYTLASFYRSSDRGPRGLALVPRPERRGRGLALLGLRRPARDGDVVPVLIGPVPGPDSRSPLVDLFEESDRR